MLCSTAVAGHRDSPPATTSHFGTCVGSGQSPGGWVVVELCLPVPSPAANWFIGRPLAPNCALDDAQVEKLAGTSDEPIHRFRTPAQIHHAVLQLAAGSRFAVGQQPAAGEPPDVKSICRHVTAAAAKYFGLTLADLKGKSRRQAVADARGLAMYIARRLTAASYAELGRHFGGRDIRPSCTLVAKSLSPQNMIQRFDASSRN